MSAQLHPVIAEACANRAFSDRYMAVASAALEAEIVEIRKLVAANVPVESMWMSPKGQIWTVIHRTDDGIVVLSRRGVTKHGSAGLLLTSGYRRI